MCWMHIDVFRACAAQESVHSGRYLQHSVKHPVVIVIRNYRKLKDSLYEQQRRRFKLRLLKCVLHICSGSESTGIEVTRG